MNVETANVRGGVMLHPADEKKFSRACGCLAGQFCGDAFGAQYEFMPEAQIAALMKANGDETMAASSVWNTLPGQITDDSEMALALASSIIDKYAYDAKTARKYYVDWMESRPFDIGHTTISGLRGLPTQGSQANGALMRVSPLAVYLAADDAAKTGDWTFCDQCAAKDAAITHANPVCVQANVLYVRFCTALISQGSDVRGLYEKLKMWAAEIESDKILIEAIEAAAAEPPQDYARQQGWVKTAFHNAVYQLLHAQSPAEAIIDTVRRGGDTDTNGAIAGALVGARFGYEAFPKDWLDKVNGCRPGGSEPRPERYWVKDVRGLARKLLSARS